MDPRSLDEITKLNEPMARHTSFRIGGPAEVFVEPRNHDELKLALNKLWIGDKPLYVLGGGANLLVSDDGLQGVVICTRRGELRSIEVIAKSGREWAQMICGGGASLGEVVKTAAEHGLTGLECLAGIPGSIGGAVVMNAGGKHGCIGQSVSRVTTVNAEGMADAQTNEMQLCRYGRSDIRFGYRSSRFREASMWRGLTALAEDPSDRETSDVSMALCSPIILEVELRLKKGSRQEKIRAHMDSILRERKGSQPMSAKSAGCIFRNPPGESAGRLIDEAGLKGFGIGDAIISPKHANFIVNRGNARAKDVLQLVNIITEKTRQSHGVELELEIDVWGNMVDG